MLVAYIVGSGLKCLVLPDAGQGSAAGVAVRIGAAQGFYATYRRTVCAQRAALRHGQTTPVRLSVTVWMAVPPCTEWLQDGRPQLLVCALCAPADSLINVSERAAVRVLFSGPRWGGTYRTRGPNRDTPGRLQRSHLRPSRGAARCSRAISRIVDICVARGCSRRRREAQRSLGVEPTPIRE